MRIKVFKPESQLFIREQPATSTCIEQKGSFSFTKIRVRKGRTLFTSDIAESKRNLGATGAIQDRYPGVITGPVGPHDVKRPGVE